MVYAIESPLWRMIAAKQYAFSKKRSGGMLVSRLRKY